MSVLQHVCQVSSKPNQTISPYLLYPIPVVGEPLECIIVNCVGPLPCTKAGFLLTTVPFPCKSINHQREEDRPEEQNGKDTHARQPAAQLLDSLSPFFSPVVFSQYRSVFLFYFGLEITGTKVVGFCLV